MNELNPDEIKKALDDLALYKDKSNEDLIEHLACIMWTLQKRDMICPETTLRVGLEVTKEMEIHKASHEAEKN